MTEQIINTTTVHLSQDNLEISAYLAHPQAYGSYPAIVVLQEIFGVNIHIREVTERIAQQGYVAIAPALFQRQAPGFETGYTPEYIEIGRKYAWTQTQVSELLNDIQSAIDYLKNLPQVKPHSFGCIGFCFGGHVAYLAATLPDIKATASFYGAGIVTRTPGGGAPTITRTPEIKGTIYTFFGMEDVSIPSEHIDQIAAELEKCKISHRVFRYDGADHGFFCDHRASYNPKAAGDAWEQVKQLFHSVLGA
ncbi:dienelactone hydrolase family protein [Umezakia ovalisporum]|jgi:carboxymethylenebutenolidase|uniref:Dienelactone hydrolase family protein n=2 Tax=Umezakia ovalisporum TaxID=75695 RepID=A0AA43KG10_9CYAN|nr:dienelactone hydrolase family protein [Umezakia ovalisporum]MBI1240850.1 dienelactone hydrolase family protein [Nostoc sp. RI_552]MDH6057293.1 dienelactone hydrolase family protein [Umezakia ovalisporum FSS-43]MDH6065504.1 dienelactone hydrolase family protein [Umezakia ovalisporum FSS-62]MDH6068600.1 dienelactone hydrolase family protein [Umezakia ovalisporum APH033B]MDH6069321.1 dienelactone hydrolase family protein [Umezakia ovalisporum CobakiLakeA]